MEPVILKRNRVTTQDRRRPLNADGTPAQAQVRTLVHDGVVRAIEVVCCCGETVTVELQLPESTQAQANGDPT